MRRLFLALVALLALPMLFGTHAMAVAYNPGQGAMIARDHHRSAGLSVRAAILKQFATRDVQLLVDGHRVSATGPWLVCTENTNPSGLRMGIWFPGGPDPADVTGEPCEKSRWLYWVYGDPDSNGVPQGSWLTQNGNNWVAATNGCAWVVTKDSQSANGTAWKLDTVDGHLYIVSRYCNTGDHYGNVMETNNKRHNRWGIMDRTDPVKGYYYKMVIEAPPNGPMAHTTALVSHRCTAKIGPSAWGRDWFESQWDTNDCGYSQRGFAHCQEGRDLKTPAGGWVKAELKWSRATCAPGYTLKGGGYDIKQCLPSSSCPHTRHWVTGNVPPARVA